MCSHKTKTQAHGQQTNHQHEHVTNEKTHKPRVHPRHDNMKACSQWIVSVQGSEHHAPTWNKARRRDSARLERAQST